MPGEETRKPKSDWDKLKTLGTFIASIFIPIVLLVVGNASTKAIKESEISLRYTELAIDILSEPPDAADKELRKWAMEVITMYSTVPINQQMETVLYQKPLTNLYRRFDDALSERVVDEILRDPAAMRVIQNLSADRSPEEIRTSIGPLIRNALQRSSQTRYEVRTPPSP